MTKFQDLQIIKILRHRNARRILVAFLIFAIAVSSGVIGYMIIEKMTLLEAMYMTTITISTVGFGEVHPLSDNGKIFTIFLIIFNIGAFAYAVSVLSSFILEGDFKALFKATQMEKNIEMLKDHIIVCGYGRLGRVVCEDLYKSGKQILVVERDSNVIEELEEKSMYHFRGDATIDETIVNIGIQKAATIIITFHSDASNVFIALAAREINPKITIISRASQEANISKLKLAGANHVIIPENIGGSYIASIITRNTDYIGALSKAKKI